MSHQSEEL